MSLIKVKVAPEGGSSPFLLARKDSQKCQSLITNYLRKNLKNIFSSFPSNFVLR